MQSAEDRLRDAEEHISLLRGERDRLYKKLIDHESALHVVQRQRDVYRKASRESHSSMRRAIVADVVQVLLDDGYESAAAIVNQEFNNQ